MFYFKNKTCVRMFGIHKMNKHFDMIPRMKHYKDIVSFFCCLFFNINWATYLLLSFFQIQLGNVSFAVFFFSNSIGQMHYLGLGLKGIPSLPHLFEKKDYCQKKTNYFFVTAGNKSSLVRFLILGLSRNKSFTKFCSCFF